MKKYLHLSTLFLASMLAIPANGQQLLDPATQPQFQNPLPAPPVLDARQGGKFTITISQFEKELGLIHPSTGEKLKTTVWGYNGSYPGPTILATKDKEVEILWDNQLVDKNGPLPHLFPIDKTLKWALMDEEKPEEYGVPIVTHLHGGHTEAASDGLPEAWFTPGFKKTGKDFVKKTLHYKNDQQAATIWYHDHAEGITRQNVYAGLAGYYLITDANEKALQNSYQLPSGPYYIGLAIQDRMFTAKGQLYYPTMPEYMGAPSNSIQPEFFGNIILVNGAVWPVLEVEPRAYRFRLLNGSDSRFYNLFLSSNQSFIQIASENGLLPSPVVLSKVLLGTGERKDVIIDFSDPALEGQTIILRNNAKTPYPSGASADPQTTGRIMAFKVTKSLDMAIPKAVLPATLRGPIQPLVADVPARGLILFEATDEYNRLRPSLGTVEEGVKTFSDPVTEIIEQNKTQVWEIHNETVDAHPIHLHMVSMQLVNRQKFNASIDMITGKPTNIRYIGNPIPPSPDKAGWKDTYIAYPGEVLRVIAKFDLAGTYTWHCHILSHEDHEMMRPYTVVPDAEKATKIIDPAHLTAPVEEKRDYQFKAIPNPFNNNLQLRFYVEKPSPLVVNIYDSKGVFVQQVFKNYAAAGPLQLEINGSNWRSGVYFCELKIGEKRLLRKLILE